MTDLSTEENATFDFISDAGFRAVLTSDYRELLDWEGGPALTLPNNQWVAPHLVTFET
jgi:hypothetical protein